MKICRIPEWLQRTWRHLRNTGMEVWTYSWDILFPRIQELATDVWLAYSRPLPSSHNQLLCLFLMCCCIAAAIGGFFYNWMLLSLQYSFQFSAAAASAISFLALLTLFLIHPIRCMFTIIVPTLGTKQGRRLLLSATFMIVAVNIVPNIISNIETILQVIRCICKSSSESLLNSTALLGSASWDFSEALKQVNDNMPDKTGRARDGHVRLETRNNNLLLSQRIISASREIKEDFLQVEVLVQKVILLGNRVMAGFFLFYLIFESAWYLKSYLTDLRFDNVYITKKLEDLAQENKATYLLVSSPKKLIKSTGFRLSREELLACVMQLFLLTLVLLLPLVIIATDYIAFHLAQAAVTEVTQFPVVPMVISIKYEVKLIFVPFLEYIFNGALSTEQSLPPFEKSYHQNLTFASATCPMRWPNPPNKAVVLAIGLLYCIIYAMIFLETYSRRLCRKISASFFDSQEDRRVQYLYGKLVRKHNKKKKTGHQQKPTMPS